MKDKIVLLSRSDSRQPGERTVHVIDVSNFSTFNRLLGGSSASGKETPHI